jgi:hypothetical protein
MTQNIIQEVREAREEIAAEFGNDRVLFWAWARKQQETERQTKPQLPAITETEGKVAKSSATQKRRVRAAVASA